MTENEEKRKSVFITGAAGYIGRQLVSCLSGDPGHFDRIVAADVKEVSPEDRAPGVDYVVSDVRSEDLDRMFQTFSVQIVVHLATIVTPGRDSDRGFEYSVDVLGTENVIRACIQTGVEQLVVTSSGAAYGYHADSPDWLEESDPLRGNPEFAYSDHKRQVEEMLARYRETHPALKQLIFRPGTVLGRTARNQITALFEKPILLGLRGTASPFVLVWDKDLVACIVKGIKEGKAGIYNVAGDGALTMKEMAGIMGKPYLSVPVWLVRTALMILKAARMTQYGPEQVNFLRYRPVLDNRRLKEAFGYVPEKTTREVFHYYLETRGATDKQA